MKSLLLIFAAGVCSLMVACGGGDAALGEECGESGADGECAEGGICGKSTSDETLQCIKICIDQSECAAGEDCNGVEGSSVKGCRIKDSSK